MGAWSYIVTGLIFLVGLLVGAILGLNGFGQPATPGTIGQSPRIKNLLWLFSGFLPALLLDFQKLGLPKDVSTLVALMAAAHPLSLTATSH